MAYLPGDVVLVPFPFRDRLAERARPAVVVSSAGYNVGGDVIVAAVTSHAPRAVSDVALVGWRAANLKLPSTLRMLLATVAHERILHCVGQLIAPDWQAVQVQLRNVIATS